MCTGPAMTWSLPAFPNSRPSNLMPCSPLSGTAELMTIKLHDVLCLHAFNCCAKTLGYNLEKSVQTRVKRTGNFFKKPLKILTTYCTIPNLEEVTAMKIWLCIIADFTHSYMDNVFFM